MENSRAWTVFIMSFISLFEIIKLLFQIHAFFCFWIPAAIAEAGTVISNGAKIFCAKGTATATTLPNNDPKNPPD